MKFKEVAKRVWKFLWHEESVWSWAVNVVLAFIIIKFIFFPVAGFVTGTDLPIVAVVSSSMDHGPVNGVLCGEQPGEDDRYWDVCGDWYETRGITEQQFETFPLDNGFWKGDVILLRGSNPEKLDVGDVIVFQSAKAYPIIHRVVSINQSTGEPTTKGDHNPDSIEEFAISDGRYWYRCYSEQGRSIVPSPCGPGVEIVTEATPGAVGLLDETNIPHDRIVGKAYARIPLVGYIKIWFVDLLTFVGLTSVTQVI